MKTVKKRWQEFEAAVMPKGASPLQVQEMRRSFYAGFYSALHSCLEMADESGENDDVGVTMLDGLYRECLAFKEDVAAGRA